MERKKLSDQEIDRSLGNLNGWRVVDGKLHRDFEFADFVGAFGFMARAALIAEQMNHHPDWCNVYNRVSINLMTHDLGGISSFDVEFASRLNKLQP